MIFLYILFSVYILSVNFYGFRYVKSMRDGDETGESHAGDGKLFLTALLGGAPLIFVSLLTMRYRQTSMTLMILLPLLIVINIYCFFLGFRGIYFM